MAKSKKTAPTRTLVTLLLDRSGSMQSLKDDTIGAINAYLGTLRDCEDDIRFSLVMFDTGPGGGMELQKLHVGVPVSQIADLTSADFMPRGGTPLIDAACSTIRAVGESLSGDDGNTRVVMAIQTDGQENSSVENNWNDLKALIAEKEGMGWEFTFMGCGIDAYDQGRRMGIAQAKTVSYGKDAAQTHAAFAATALNTRAFASGAAASLDYSAEQKLRAGDMS